jgi:hypothetical protein
MLYHIDKFHPRVIIKDRKTGKTRFVKHPVSHTKTGWVWCTRAWRESEFSPYGVGVTLYFQFLKFLATIFAIQMILSVPAFLFYYNGNTSVGEGGLKAYFSQLSLGNIGQCKH